MDWYEAHSQRLGVFAICLWIAALLPYGALAIVEVNKFVTYFEQKI